MKPILYSVYFVGQGPNAGFYRRLANVLRYTAGAHCPDWDIRIVQTTAVLDAYPAFGTNRVSHTFTSNTHKLDHWNQMIQSAPEGARVLLIDTDTMIVNPIDSIWEQEFDIAYTTKKHKLPFNGGVLFLRVSEHTRQFMASWTETNLSFLEDDKQHAPWRQKYGGMNQASFGALIPVMKSDFGINLIEIPCLEWNCEQSAWRLFDAELTKIVHVKSGLRKAVMGRATAEPQFKGLMDLWLDMDAEAREAVAVR